MFRDTSETCEGLENTLQARKDHMWDTMKECHCAVTAVSDTTRGKDWAGCLEEPSHVKEE